MNKTRFPFKSSPVNNSGAGAFKGKWRENYAGVFSTSEEAVDEGFDDYVAPSSG